MSDDSETLRALPQAGSIGSMTISQLKAFADSAPSMSPIDPMASKLLTPAQVAAMQASGTPAPIHLVRGTRVVHNKKPDEVATVIGTIQGSSERYQIKYKDKRSFVVKRTNLTVVV
jgi:hypothetical protein